MCLTSPISAKPAVPQYHYFVKVEHTAGTTWEKTSTDSQQALTAFKSEASSITTPDQLLKNYKALKVVLGAYDMSSNIDQTAVLKQLMTQDPTSSTSLAQRSGNASWKAFATAFSDWSTSPLASADTVSTITQKYLTNGYENSVQDEPPGLGDALYFTRTVTSDTKLIIIMSDS